MTVTPSPTDVEGQYVLHRLQAALAGRYAVGEQIGRGGMALVFRARDLRHARDVAVKVLSPELATGIAADRFVFEIATAAKLMHPHILGLIDSGDAGGVLYYIMPMVQGESLRARLERERRLTTAEAVRIALEVASALEHAHAHGIVHRDIKPENILLADGTHALVADFGLARAIVRSSDPSFTASRHIVGTVLYMSPEQLGGAGDIDGRSDVYSLGCVLYEMLAGDPPFMGDNPRAVMAGHLLEPPPRPSSRGVPVPAAVEDVVLHALEKEPARRIQGAGDFCRDLASANTPSAATWRQRVRRALPSGRARAWTVLAALVAVAAAATLMTTSLAERAPSWLGAWAGPHLDERRYVILPFWAPRGAAIEAGPELLLHDAMARWDGVSVVDQFQVNDALARHDTLHITAEVASRVARSLGAGQYVRGEVTALGDSLRVHATLYDARDGRRLDQASAVIPRALGAQEESYRRLADAMIFHGERIDGHEAERAATRSYAALSAYLRGRRALAEWNLAAADSAFSVATASDPEFSAAALWLGQVRSWLSDTPPEWRVIASRAVAGSAQLPPREQTLARALLHLASGELPEACALYARLKQADPRDFAATYGLGECIRRDSIVVRDGRSRSGWRFRGNRAQAMKAYREAFELLPSIHRAFRARAFERLRGILMTATATRVEGRALAPDTMEFRAAPAWEGDSLVLIPYPKELALESPEQTVSSTAVEAVDHQRELFREIAAAWRRSFPGDVEPLEAMAVALELQGDSTALDTLRRARRMASDADTRTRLAAGEVWVRVKFGLPDDVASLDIARALADSLLTANAARPSPHGDMLAGLAVLTGHADLGATLARQTAVVSPAIAGVPVRTVAAARALLVYSAVGAPADSLRALEPRVVTDVRNSVAASRQKAVLTPLLAQAAGLAFPVYRFHSMSELTDQGNTIVDLQDRLAHGDSAGARAQLGKFERLRHARRPADLTLDYTVPAAWAWADLGDDAGALRVLDPVLSSSTLFPPQSLSRIANAGALMRSLAMRARLAAKAGDTVGARRWARPAVILWANADPSLQSVVAEMRRLAAPR